MVQFSRNAIKAILMFFFLFLGTNGCKKDYTSTIPYVYVDLSINPSNIIELNIPGGSIFLPNAGYGGIIIFRDLVDSSNPFLAFDATCTYEVSSIIRVTADGSGLATCPECKSQFILFGGNGSSTRGPAAEPLKQYHTYFNGGRIQIRN
jgi:nitrite reductase/ring-hydroxylating ferredoxin subunit